jgi:hypothetical protein
MARDHRRGQPNTWKVELGIVMPCPRHPWERISLFVPANGRDKAVCFTTGHVVDADEVERLLAGRAA